MTELLPHFDGDRQEWIGDLQRFRQNHLLDEGQFIDFARERGLNVQGVVHGDPGLMHARGWLIDDGKDYRGDPLFHPFRLYPLHMAIQACRNDSEAYTALDADRFLWTTERRLAASPVPSPIGEAAVQRNRVADLAILLEPIYWPEITEHLVQITGFLDDEVQQSPDEYHVGLDLYRNKALDLVKTLDPDVWMQAHTSLRTDAAWLDRNDELYLLLRLSKWEQRKKLTGRVAGSLWLRHMAEVIRRGFEEAHSVEWFEEDRAFGTWFPGGRTTAFGFERPLDDQIASRPYVAWSFGLITGSIVRWYVEGETEYAAIMEALTEPARGNIEIVNLHGNIETGRDNAAIKLREWLEEDKSLKRYSMISFDMDVAANVKAVRRQVEQGNIVGYIAAHAPDFEFANFAVEELAEVAARIDEGNGASGDAVRDADWTGVCSGRQFETRYKEVSARKPRGLKGDEWGRALVRYASEHPKRAGDNEERPFLHEIRVALQARIARYDFHQEVIDFDPETFRQVDRATDSPKSP